MASSRSVAPTIPLTTTENAPHSFIVHVRGVPVLLANQAAHAVRFGYFPVSPTGYRSFCGQSSISAADLEERAKEADQERARALHRLRQAKEIKARTPEQRFSAWISLEGALSSAMNQAYLAPEADQDKLLREIATSTEVIKPFLAPGYARPSSVGAAWTEEGLTQTIAAYHALCTRVCRLQARLAQRPVNPDAWAALVEALPKGPGYAMLVPTVLRELIGAGEPAGIEDADMADKAEAMTVTPVPASEPEMAPEQVVVAAAALPSFGCDPRGQYSLF
ncbi:hypothetical protein [Azospirillum sp. SYSU D00513]|uniref:hypothetical protein n=1 Tax=Azospirillum sp. SYSU D00513 TaxID=2812561 RepID=UPI001A957138|nr:hypothetical protein [Azospirillum sp. SYSU D00513]